MMGKLCILASLLVLSAAAPLKVIIMVGQSNMQGHGYYNKKDGGKPMNGTIDYLANDPRTAQEFSKLKDGGKYADRDDVWITYNKQKPSDTSVAVNMHGPLTVGYGGDPGENHMGPELGFGWTVGDAIQEQVLLLKVAWGGKTLAVDFRPPSSGGQTGHYYTTMVKDVNEVLSNLKTYFPSYSGSYEIAGFAWHQGFNDGLSGHPEWHEEYEKNMVNLIGDIRKEFGVAKLPVSIGVSGMFGWGGAKNPFRKLIIEAQFAAADSTKHPEFKGNVRAVETRDFHRDVQYSPGPQEFHWSNNCESYWLVGKAMGEAMVQMIHHSPEPPSPPLPPSPSPPLPPSPPSPPLPPPSPPSPPSPSDCGSCKVCLNPTNHKCQNQGSHRPTTKIACESKHHIWCGPSAFEEYV